MCVRAHLFSNRTAGLIGGAALCALVAGCAGNPFENAKVDPASPVAGEVARIANSNRPFPTFASIPAAPKDVRAPQEYGRQAQALDATRSDLERDTAPQTWSLTGTEDFAAQARRAAGSEAAPNGRGEADAFAKAQRKRATPPPPPQKPQ